MEGQNGEILKEFQISEISIKDKSSPEFGKKISEMISGTVYGGLGGYYFARNARFTKNRNLANGKIDVQAMFGDKLQFDGKQNYIKIGWQAIQIVNRIISGLVGRAMGRNEKIVVKAVDSYSVEAKEDEFKQLEFYIENREKLEQLQQQSGVKMMPDNLPADIDELMLWQSQFQRLPEEILYEIGINDICNSVGLSDVLKEKMLHDSAEVGLVGTYTWMDKEGVIHPEYCKPENIIYSYSEYPDFRDTTWRGYAPAMKISEIRKKYGVEFGGKLTEQDLWEIAGTSKDYKLEDNLTWLDQWTTSYLRPYDEWNVNSIQFELKTVDTDKYTVTTTNKTGRIILEDGLPKTSNGNVRKNPLPNQEVFDDSNINIYRGVYLPQSKKLLEWGIKKNMIRPSDPKEIGNSEFSYSFYMYQNFKMRNIAIPEKIEQPVYGMILSVLKIEQVVAKSRPPGAMINWSLLQNIDYGLGDKENKEIDVRKLFDQTGDLYYNGYDAEGKPVGIPISEIPNTSFLPAIQGWISLYQFHYQTLRDQLGEDPNMISQALQPRVAQGNVEASQRAAENATDYFYDAFLFTMEETGKKIGCLLDKSVMFGAKVYRHLLKEDDVQDRIFSTSIKMLPTEQEIAALDARMNQLIATNPDSIMYIDTSKILRIAQEDVKLAEEYYKQCMKKMLLSQQQQQSQNAQMNAQVQQASLEAKGKMDLEQLKAKLQIEDESAEKRDREKLKQIALQGAFQVMSSKEGDVQPEWAPVMTELINNLMLPLLNQNAAHTQTLGDMIGQQNQQQQDQGNQPPNPQDQQDQQPQQQQVPQNAQQQAA